MRFHLELGRLDPRCRSASKMLAATAAGAAAPFRQPQLRRSLTRAVLALQKAKARAQEPWQLRMGPITSEVAGQKDEQAAPGNDGLLGMPATERERERERESAGTTPPPPQITTLQGSAQAPPSALPHQGCQSCSPLPEQWPVCLEPKQHSCWR
jgi:hypothetical protein